MKKLAVDKYKKVALPAFFLLPAAKLSAQEQQEDDDVLIDGNGRDIRMIEEEDTDMFIEGILYINMRRYMNELVSLIVLVIVIAVVNHFTSKRNRTGCIFFTILIAVVWYVIRRYLP